MSYQVKIIRKNSRHNLNDGSYVELRLIQNLSRRARLESGAFLRLIGMMA